MAKLTTKDDRMAEGSNMQTIYSLRATGRVENLSKEDASKATAATVKAKSEKVS